MTKRQTLRGSSTTASHSATATVAETTAWRPIAGSAGSVGNSGVAVWRQIAEDIEMDIETGRLAKGDRLPSEMVLAGQFGVNRHTLRRAINELAQKGLVEATPGRGTFVSGDRIAYPIGRSTQFSQAIAEIGREPRGQLLGYATVRATPVVAELLEIRTDSEVVQLEYLRSANELPICLSTAWFPADRFADIGEAYAKFGTITKSLAKFGVREYRRTRTLITSRAANGNEREHLGLERGASVLVVDSANSDSDGRPIQAGHSRFAAERVQLVVENDDLQN
ncbi:MAG: phosphonate metabolism transcriptional regulator PhnF [Pseudomonadota bacterium]